LATLPADAHEGASVNDPELSWPWTPTWRPSASPFAPYGLASTMSSVLSIPTTAAGGDASDAPDGTTEPVPESVDPVWASVNEKLVVDAGAIRPW
jgi:hypothetical protein